MNGFRRAMRIYLKSAYSLLLIAFGALLTLGMAAGGIIDPAAKGSDDYSAMLGCIFIGHVGMILANINGCIILMRDKYFASLPVAKTLYTVVPVVISVIPCLIYDILLTIISFWLKGTDVGSDILLVSVLGSMTACLAVTTNGKKTMLPFSVPALLLFGFGFPIISGTDKLDSGFGLSIYTVAAIAAGIYVFTVILSLMLLRKWWKSDDRINRNLNVNVYSSI